MTDIAAVTQQGIDALTARAPQGAQIDGQYDEEVSAWTWMLAVPTPTEEYPDAKQGVSRQFVATPEAPSPSASYLDLMVTEMLSTFPTGATA